MNKFVVDVGGTFIKYAVMDDDANIVSKVSVATPLEKREDFIQTIVDLYKERSDEVDGLAMSLPGNIDSDTGFVYTPGALRFNYQTPLAQDLQDAIWKQIGKKVNVSIENDGKSAALAELWKGNLSDCKDGVVIILGTGIGGGIILDRKVVKGKDFFAGEFSFLMNDVHKKGFENCFANGNSAIALTKKVAGAKGLEESEVDGFKVFELLDAEDEETKQVFDQVVSGIAGQIYNLTCILNPERVLIGGGISKQSRLIEAIQEKTKQYYDSISIPMPRTEVDVCKFFNDSNLIGALYHYKRLYEGE